MTNKKPHKQTTQRQRLLVREAARKESLALIRAWAGARFDEGVGIWTEDDFTHRDSPQWLALNDSIVDCLDAVREQRSPSQASIGVITNMLKRPPLDVTYDAGSFVITYDEMHEAAQRLTNYLNLCRSCGSVLHTRCRECGRLIFGERSSLQFCDVKHHDAYWNARKKEAQTKPRQRTKTKEKENVRRKS